MNKEKFFISYSLENADIVLPVVKRMQEFGCCVWYRLPDEPYENNQEVLENTITHVSESSKVVVFLSSALAESKQFKLEIDVAVRHNKPIYIILLERLNPTSNIPSAANIVNVFFTTESYIDYINPLRRCCQFTYAGASDVHTFHTLYSSAMRPNTDNLPANKPAPLLEVSLSKVQFSAIAPKQIIPGNSSVINIIVYEAVFRDIVEDIIKHADTDVKETRGSIKNVRYYTNIRVVLSSPDIDIDDCNEVQQWQGGYLIYDFFINPPKEYTKNQILITASVYFDDVIATKLKFIVDCNGTDNQKIQLTRQDILSAFVSYASKDRSKVATIIQGMKKARPDMDIFFDVDCLHSGEYWETSLKKELDERNVLFLCWSKNAKRSRWVSKEWHYFLNVKGLDSIEPVPLVSPKKCPPPKELESKHFNDRALLYQ